MLGLREIAMDSLMMTDDSSRIALFLHAVSSIRRMKCWLIQSVMIVLSGLLMASGSLAQTSVDGSIVVDTQWTLEGSPYIVSGDVVVRDTAMLRIDPGVTVYMALGASLTVQSGGIRAEGTVAYPIRVLSDKTRQGDAGVAGDWKHWIFAAGSNSTLLDNVIFEHGSGLIVKGSAPVFNYLQIRNQAGPAIEVDLSASLSGTGNQASENMLNGVLVPPGDIQGDIKWGLRGIPYIVSSGVISVGASPVVNSVTPGTLRQGETSIFQIAGARLQGLSEVRFSVSGLSAQILPGATDTQAAISVSASTEAAKGVADLFLLVDAGEIRILDALEVLHTQPQITEFLPSELYRGQGTAEVIVSGHDFTDQSVVVVDGHTVPTRYVSSTQLVATLAVPEDSGAITTFRVHLKTPDPAQTGQFLVSNELSLPISVAKIALSPSSVSVTQGKSETLMVSLPYAAPTGGVALDLVSSVPTVVTTPSTVVIPEGQSSINFLLSGVDAGNSVITASKLGFQSGQTQVTVVVPPELSLSPASTVVGSGRTVQMEIQSNVPAGASGLTVNLFSDNAEVVTLPVSVVIPAGASSALFEATTLESGAVTVTARAPGFLEGVADILVRSLSLTLPAGALVAPGLSRSVPVMLSDPAPEDGLEIMLASDDEAIASVAASITIPSGQTSGNFILSGVGAGTTTLVATATGYQSASLPVTVEVVTITVGSPAVGSISLPVDNARHYAVTLSRPAPAGGVSISLAMNDPKKATVVPSVINIPEGQTSGGTVQAEVAGIVEGATVLTAAAVGLNTVSVPVTVTKKPDLNFSRGNVMVGKGLRNDPYEIYVTRMIDGAIFNGTEALAVTLTSSDVSKVRVPSTVTIPAGSYFAYFAVEGVDLTEGAPVTIEASAEGYTSSAKLAVNVTPLALAFSYLDGRRSPASMRDDFSLWVTASGRDFFSGQTAAVDIPIDLSIVEANPVGIVENFYNDQNGGSVIKQVLLRKGSYRSDPVYVDIPTKAGSYKVRASVADAVDSTSGVVTVSVPGLNFSRGSVVVGKGLRNDPYEIYVTRVIDGAFFNGAEELTVKLTPSDASKVRVPATVTIPAGSYFAYFAVEGVDLTEGAPVTIEASAEGYASSANLAVNVTPLTFAFSYLDDKRSPASMRDDFSLWVTASGRDFFSGQTAAVDIPIDLSIVDANPVGIVENFYNDRNGGSVIKQVLLRKGGYRSDPVYVDIPTKAGSYKVRASVANAADSTSGVVTVSAPELSFSKGSVVVGKGLRNDPQEVYVTRVIDGALFNGAEELTVRLTPSDASKVRVPATVTIPAGSYFAYFAVEGVDLTEGAPVTIEASAEGYVSSANLAVNVTPLTFAFSYLDDKRSPASMRDDFSLWVTASGTDFFSGQTAAVDIPIDLSIVDANPAGIVENFYNDRNGGSVIKQVLLRKGGYRSDPVYVDIPTKAGSYKVRASVADVADSTSGVVTVSAPELNFSKGSVVVGKGLRNDPHEVYVTRVIDGAIFNGVEELTVNLSCSSTVICRVPAMVTIPAGGYHAYFTVEGVGVGTTTVTASAVDYGAPRQDLAVGVAQPRLSLNGLGDATVGAQRRFYVSFSTPGADYHDGQKAIEAITVNLTSSAPGIATVPATVTIPAGAVSSGWIDLTGVAPGVTTVTASGHGLESVTSDVITINP
jgi:hypothetical protein